MERKERERNWNQITPLNWARSQCFMYPSK